MKKILILGGSGFIGKNLVLYFSKKYSVTAIYFKNKPKEKIFKNNNINWLKVNLLNEVQIEKLFKKKYDFVIQSAAFTAGIKVMLKEPFAFISSNSIMNSLILQKLTASSVKHFISLSCTVMYNNSSKPLKEKDFDYYKQINKNYEGIAYTKLYTENLCKYYSTSTDIKFTSLRHSNIYGPYDKFFSEKSHFMAASLTKFLNNSNVIKVWGEGKEKRDFLYIDDLSRGIEKILLNQKNKYEIYNLSLGKSYSVKEVINLIKKTTNSEKKIIFEKNKPTMKINILVSNNKIIKSIGWKPQFSLKKGIQKTIQWIVKNY
tara:strand:+ start:1682 stop:2632 length:951 start_codon:yes stop_codon:yes gene_type:complete